MPTVSIIVPNYNHAPFLVQRLDSVFNQTYQDFEVILLDDASNDNSLEILRHYAARYPDKITHFIINQHNSGSPFKQWKKGIELAQGAYIWIAESDDWAEPELLQTLLNPFLQDSRVGLSYCQSMEVDEHSNKIRDFHFWTDDLDEKLWKGDFILPGSTFLSHLAKKNVIPNASAVLFQKALYIEVGKVQTDFKLTGDWDMWVRLLSKSNVAYSPLCLNHFRSTRNTTRYIVSKEKKELRILEERRVVQEIARLNLIEKELIRTQQHHLSNQWKTLYELEFEPRLLFKNFNFAKLNLLRIHFWTGLAKSPKVFYCHMRAYLANR